jgi:hypothetical protein
MQQKKGEIIDIIILVITTFILAIGFLVIIFVVPNITGGLKTAGLNNSAEGISAIAQLEDFGINGINYGFMFLFFGLIASVMITSFFVRTHPIWLFLYVIFLAITILLAVYLGNAYYDIQNSDTFASMINNASFINLVMNNIVEITLAVGVLSMIIIFAKFSTYGGSAPM